MGKIWLKSVDPSRQCCGCEGKTSPCDSCCERQIVYTPKTSDVPSLISLNAEKRDLENYPSNKIYASSLDQWTIDPNQLSFSMDVTQELENHTNRFAINLLKDQIIEININFLLSANGYPSSLSYSQFPDRVLSDISTVTRPFIFQLIANRNTVPEDLEILSATDSSSVGGTSNSILYARNVTVSESFASISDVESYQSNPVVCNYNFQAGYVGNNSSAQSILDSLFTINRVLIQTSTYILTWDINGFWARTNNSTQNDCSAIESLNQSPPVFNGTVVNYFVKGYEFETSYDSGDLPIDPPVGTQISGTDSAYAIVYTRPVKYMTKTATDSNTVRIKALKSACLYVLIDRANYSNPSQDYPSASLKQSINGTITSNRPINVLPLKFEEYDI